jgi:hypothetical protein
MIRRDSQIEDIIHVHKGLVGLLIRKGLPCVVCGEPFWGTVEELAHQKGWDDSRIDKLVAELNEELGD